jgi:hypothetical protein
MVELVHHLDGWSFYTITKRRGRLVLGRRMQEGRGAESKVVRRRGRLRHNAIKRIRIIEKCKKVEVCFNGATFSS